MHPQAQADELLRRLTEAPDEARFEMLLEACREPSPMRGLLLNDMLANPEKSLRDLAADVANELGVNPLAEAEAVVAEAAPADEPAMLCLGFDDDCEASSAPPPPEAREADASLPEIRFQGPPEDVAGPVLHIGHDEPAAARPHAGRNLALAICGAVLGLATFAWFQGDSASRRRAAATCRGQRAVLTRAVDQYRTQNPDAELANRFFGDDLQGVLRRSGVLTAEVSCPLTGGAYALAADSSGRVMCRKHGL